MDETNLQSQSEDLLNKLNNITSTLLPSLTGDPHPNNSLKNQYFDEGHVFPTIHDLETPEDFCPHACIKALSEIREQQEIVNEQHLEHLETNCEHLGNAFATHDGEQFNVNHDKVKKYIEFHEIVNSIPVEYISKANTKVIGQKLLTHFINIHN